MTRLGLFWCSVGSALFGFWLSLVCLWAGRLDLAAINMALSAICAVLAKYNWESRDE